MKHQTYFSLTALAHINNKDIARLITIKVKSLETSYAPGYLKQTLLYCKEAQPWRSQSLTYYSRNNRATQRPGTYGRSIAYILTMTGRVVTITRRQQAVLLEIVRTHTQQNLYFGFWSKYQREWRWRTDRCGIEWQDWLATQLKSWCDSSDHAISLPRDGKIHLIL